MPPRQLTPETQRFYEDRARMILDDLLAAELRLRLAPVGSPEFRQRSTEFGTAWMAAWKLIQLGLQHSDDPF